MAEDRNGAWGKLCPSTRALSAFCARRGWCANQSRFCSSCCLVRSATPMSHARDLSEAAQLSPISCYLLHPQHSSGARLFGRAWTAERGLQSVVVNSRLLALYVRPGWAQPLPVAFHKLTPAELYIRRLSTTLRRRFSRSKSSQRTCSWVDVPLPLE